MAAAVSCFRGHCIGNAMIPRVVSCSGRVCAFAPVDWRWAGHVWCGMESASDQSPIPRVESRMERRNQALEPTSQIVPFSFFVTLHKADKCGLVVCRHAPRVFGDPAIERVLQSIQIPTRVIVSDILDRL